MHNTKEQLRQLQSEKTLKCHRNNKMLLGRIRRINIYPPIHVLRRLNLFEVLISAPSFCGPLQGLFSTIQKVLKVNLLPKCGMEKEG